MTLTPREEKAFAFIRAQIKTHGMAPTLEEIAGCLGSPKSKSAAMHLVDTLVFEGLVRRLPQRARGLELIETKDNHASDCNCLVCADARYLAQLKLVEALQVFAPVALAGKLRGLRSPGQLERLYWLKGFPRKLAVSRKQAALPREGAG